MVSYRWRRRNRCPNRRYTVGRPRPAGHSLSPPAGRARPPSSPGSATGCRSSASFPADRGAEGQGSRAAASGPTLLAGSWPGPDAHRPRRHQRFRRHPISRPLAGQYFHRRRAPRETMRPTTGSRPGRRTSSTLLAHPVGHRPRSEKRAWCASAGRGTALVGYPPRHPRARGHLTPYVHPEWRALQPAGASTRNWSDWVRKGDRPIASPPELCSKFFAPGGSQDALPARIMLRILRQVAPSEPGPNLGDTSTLSDPSVVR